MTPHPAKFSKAILAEIAKMDLGFTLDPFSGVGSLANVVGNCVCLEIEPEWAMQTPGTAVIGNALKLPFRNSCFDSIMTSCVYGNRMSDHHNAKDTSKRNTYKHYLGRDPNPVSSAIMQYGMHYKWFHQQAWVESLRVLKPNCKFVLNISDHIRKGEVQPVTEWHIQTLIDLGMVLHEAMEIATPRLRHGSNYQSRVGYETLAVFTR